MSLSTLLPFRYTTISVVPPPPHSGTQPSCVFILTDVPRDGRRMGTRQDVSPKGGSSWLSFREVERHPHTHHTDTWHVSYLLSNGGAGGIQWMSVSSHEVPLLLISLVPSQSGWVHWTFWLKWLTRIFGSGDRGCFVSDHWIKVRIVKGRVWSRS